MVYVTRGSGILVDAQQREFPVTPGSCFLVFPKLAHAYGPTDGTTWSEHYIVFEGQLFHTWQRSGLLKEEAPLYQLEPISYWVERFQKVTNYDCATTSSQALRHVSMLHQLLTDIIASNEDLHASEQAPWLDKARMLMGEGDHPMSPQETAAACGLAYETFRKEFRRLTGQTPGQFRVGVVMNRACELMMREGLTNQEIAERLGFCDEFHFSKRFRAIRGLSPRAFRQQLSHVHPES